MRDVEIPNWLKELPLAPVFYPTETEFADPIAYISKIEKEASAFGICKVIPPLPKPTKKYVLANLNKSLLKSPELGNDVKLNNVEKVNSDEFRAVFTTRHQELGYNNGKRTKEDVGSGSGSGSGSGQPVPPVVKKQVWQSGEIYTLDQFESKSKTFAKSQLGMVKDVSPLVIESLFWKSACEKPIYIEYANDVPGSGFGEPVGPTRSFHKHRRKTRTTFNRHNKDETAPKSKSCNPSSSIDALNNDTNSLDNDQEIEGASGCKLSNCAWNLQVIARSPGSLTRFMPDDIPGVTSPMVYIGMLFSWFAWHVEDHELHSLNFLHFGSSKTWYSVPGDYAFTFEEVIRSKAYGRNIDRLAALTLLGEKTTLLSPETVVKSGIPCCRLVQKPGEFVVTFPRAYHIGFSHGFNCGEAANFGTPKWLSIAKEAAVRRAAMNFLPMLSHQQLLYLLTMSFIPRVPKFLLPGIRSSRLKDRQKEERELLVKKEFIEDIIKENKLLNYILEKNSSYRAVLWDLESLSPSLITNNENNFIKNDNNNLDSERVVNIEDDDMANDFQIDSGTLPCVACGVLGYPFMSVIQPSENVLENKWNMCNGYLRPRIFCLKHATEIEKLLDPMGGAKLLIVCHSDFQKIKVQVSAIAEQIDSRFVYNEVELHDAIKDDLDLINLAIDNEQEDDCVEDWTMKLSVNLRHSVKLRPKLSPDKMHHGLTMDELFTETPPISSVGSGSMVLQWQDKKSRSDRKINCSIKKLSKTVNLVKDCEVQNPKKEGALIQYSRRKFKSKMQDFVILTPEKLDLQNEKQVFLLIEDAKTHNSMEMEDECGLENSPGSVSCATTIENSGIEKDGEETDLQNETNFINQGDEGSELTKLGGSSADEPVADSNVRVKKGDVNDENTPVSSSRKLSKRKREEKSDLDGFIKSPCEGLRPRGGKDLHKDNKGGIFITIQEKPAKKSNDTQKPAKKPNTSKNANNTPENLEKQGSHKCDHEACIMSFKTKTELNLHRKNRCPHEGCGKKFSSHRYAVLHLRVHDNNRPLKCTWEGCKMTFKWAWARTEHLRVHTGERPYKCKVEDCGLTFRFVSDFSRHRRKTGHNNAHVKVKS